MYPTLSSWMDLINLFYIGQDTSLDIIKPVIQNNHEEKNHKVLATLNSNSGQLHVSCHFLILERY